MQKNKNQQNNKMPSIDNLIQGVKYNSCQQSQILQSLVPSTMYNH